ncbi:MAG: DUF4197 domain-containing protein [Pseudomonadota bacterium]|nr:DUF4197 domain-containing protein [Pseudomonadota bacterium]MDP1906053.1 DUF4197 domain-containing protein [Pseudomonadota bacterium]MDP2352523.1 DUF4197 domain-containing protein [Pseudomonadota bacterium]
MNSSRRQFTLVLVGLALAPRVLAAGVVDEAIRALRDNLGRVAQVAIARLGRENGYFGDARIKIGLPKNFAKADRYLRALGMGGRVDDLILAMNRAAEAAIPQLLEAVLDAVRKLPPVDARVLLSTADGAASAWFREHSEDQLAAKMLPLIHGVAEQSDLARAYNALSSKLLKLAGLKSELATVEDYVSRKALDGFYTLIAAEEHALRALPNKHATGVFGLRVERAKVF